MPNYPSTNKRLNWRKIDKLNSDKKGYVNAVAIARVLALKVGPFISSRHTTLRAFKYQQYIVCVRIFKCPCW